MTIWINKSLLIEALKELSDRTYQHDIWANRNNPNGWVSSYIEASCNVFDDALVADALEEGAIIFDKNVTNALQELDQITDKIDGYRDILDIINDPKMELVRQKSTEILQLIAVSDLSQNTVEFIELGQSVGD